jgi:hypothetical protein
LISGILREFTTVPPLRLATLVAFALAAVLLIPLEAFGIGLPVWAIALFLAWRYGDRTVRRNFSLLLVCILVLGFAPIHTGLDPMHFVTLGLPFLAVVLIPYFFTKWKAPGDVEWRFWPRGLSRRDIVYTLISIPLSWGIIWLYFFYLTPEMPTHWPLPEQWNDGAVTRLIVGINCVGIWDELFFINTCYVLLRAIYPKWVANAGQAVVYTSVLYHMAFTGAGPFIVYIFALTQGAMYERSRVLLWVLIVHLIVDLFLVLAILEHYYPGSSGQIFKYKLLLLS